MYYQTDNFKRQYDFGVSCARAGDKKGYYSQGVGATSHAHVLAGKGQWSRARRWARKAIRAWQRYEKAYPTYYNQYIHRAAAEGLLGLFFDMEKSLEKAAKLSGRKADFTEFQMVRRAVEKLHGKMSTQPSKKRTR